LAAGLEQGRTLGGCLIVPRGGRIFIGREPAAVAAPVPAPPGGEVCWDGRFQARFAPDLRHGLWLGALGRDSAAVARDLPDTTAFAGIPAAARATLPALRDAKGVVAVPSLGYFKRCREEAATIACEVQFRPKRSLTGAGFTIV
jgi:tRNA(Ile)-lysidine synthase